ncbi:MAG: DUF4118 domain-containing protein [Planctomycetes bacterium]|nr:DUF4118 domain-containing protein [Planctomycetota bacterium]
MKRQARLGYVWAVAVTGACTALDAALFAHVDPANLVMVYLAGVVFVATRHDRGAAGLACVLSVLSYDFFFVPPYHSLAVADTEYLLTFSIMFAVAMVVASLADRVRRQADAATERERRTAALYAMSRELASTRGAERLAEVLKRHVEQVFRGEAGVRLAPTRDAVPGGPRVADDDPAEGALRVPLDAGGRLHGELRFRVRAADRPLPAEERAFLATFAAQAALALEREVLAGDAAECRAQAEAERMRNTLLRSISHDLRTPLASIKGSSSLLLRSPDLDARVRGDLIADIEEEADYIARMVTNLLELTRLESGAVRLRKEWVPVEELVGAVTERLEQRLRAHPLTVTLPAELPAAPLDPTLIHKVLLNLLENAVEHTPAGTPVELSASVVESEVIVALADRGPGLQPGEERRVFDKFYRTTAEGRGRGMGLGLTVCEGIVRLHGGRIWAENRPGGGVTFRFSLPLVGELPPPPPPPPAFDPLLVGGEAR